MSSDSCDSDDDDDSDNDNDSGIYGEVQLDRSSRRPSFAVSPHAQSSKRRHSVKFSSSLSPCRSSGKKPKQWGRIDTNWEMPEPVVIPTVPALRAVGNAVDLDALSTHLISWLKSPTGGPSGSNTDTPAASDAAVSGGCFIVF